MYWYEYLSLIYDKSLQSCLEGQGGYSCQQKLEGQAGYYQRKLNSFHWNRTVCREYMYLYLATNISLTETYFDNSLYCI